MTYFRLSGLIRSRDNLKAKLRELAKEKPRGQTDENLIAEISRVESTMIVARDDMVMQRNTTLWKHRLTCPYSECLQTAHNGY